MSRDAKLELDFGDGMHVFRLAWGQLAELQESCDAGPFVIHNRLMDGSWRLNDIRETIRYGLIGGGMPPHDALKIVRQYVEARPPTENLIYAQLILSAGLMGAPEEKVGEPKAANRAMKKSTTSRTGKSGSPQSTETAQSSATRRKK